MNQLAMAEIGGISLRRAWTTMLTLYIAESAVVETALPAMRLAALAVAAPLTIDPQRVLQGTLAVCIVAGSVYVISQGFSSGPFLGAVSLAQGLGLISGLTGKRLFDRPIGSGINRHVPVRGGAGTYINRNNVGSGRRGEVQ